MEVQAFIQKTRWSFVNANLFKKGYGVTIVMNDRPAGSVELGCPLCSNSLDEREYEHAVRKLEKQVVDEYHKQSRNEKKEFDGKLRELKSAQKKHIQVITKNYQNQQKLLQKKLGEQKRKSKKYIQQQLRQAKRRYQIQVERVREVYNNQNITLQNELKSSFVSQLADTIKNYESFAATIQERLEILQEKLQQDEPKNELRDGHDVGQPESSSVVRQDDSLVQEEKNQVERLEALKRISQLIKEISQNQREKHEAVG